MIRGGYRMTKLEIMPGVCGLTAVVEAESEDGMDVTVKVDSPCGGIRKVMEEIGGELDAYGLLFQKPGTGALYEAAAKHCPHGTCVVPAGILKCIEAECKMALPKDVSMRFL